ncbi:unnamed protein product [Caenorhabditis bovis]|uniref:EF-hand domain-containing protein n=1 Tax=Caenorhabditis bovis TaxID=2654633 RepID=A0A8S1EN83_9PELO|nr:unnamed protein product [Caenorhabditis bovis]
MKSSATLVGFLLLLTGLCQAALKITTKVEVTAQEEKFRDNEGYEAIREIHREMDDDHSGSIDRNESTGFLKEDMHMRGSERTRRENKFHGDDDSITVDDLWEAWFESTERSWTNERLVEWLTVDVSLPTIAEVVKRKNLDGKVLPRFATQNPEFLSKELGIKSSVYRQKLRLNSLDLVLFGYRDNNNKLKDGLLAFLALLLTSLLYLYIRQRQKAHQKVLELSTRLSELKTMESEFEDVQKMLNDERSKRSTADGGVSQTEVESLRYQLEEAERRLEANSNGAGTPLALQPLLRRTCENEMTYLEKQRQECFKEMKEAIEMVDRLQKKQGSVLSSLKLATGASSTSDQVDSRIFALKNRMEKIHALTRETQERWMQIESLCGFPILYLNESEHLNHSASSSSHFYNNHSEGSTTSSSSANMNRPKFSTVSKANSTNIPLIQQKMNGVHKHHHGSRDSLLTEKMPEPSSQKNDALISFQPTEITKSIQDDAQSIETVSSVVTTSSEAKKKRSVLSKMFRKTASKGSVASS